MTSIKTTSKSAPSCMLPTLTLSPEDNGRTACVRDTHFKKSRGTAFPSCPARLSLVCCIIFKPWPKDLIGQSFKCFEIRPTSSAGFLAGSNEHAFEILSPIPTRKAQCVVHCLSVRPYGRAMAESVPAPAWQMFEKCCVAKEVRNDQRNRARTSVHLSSSQTRRQDSLDLFVIVLICNWNIQQRGMMKRRGFRLGASPFPYDLLVVMRSTHRLPCLNLTFQMNSPPYRRTVALSKDVLKKSLHLLMYTLLHRPSGFCHQSQRSNRSNPCRNSKHHKILNI